MFQTTHSHAIPMSKYESNGLSVIIISLNLSLPLIIDMSAWFITSFKGLIIIVYN
jgi:hypothetical protein